MTVSPARPDLSDERFADVNVAVMDFAKLGNQSYCLKLDNYQRPYVWSRQKVEQLLADLSAFSAQDQVGEYYLGTLLLHRDDRQEARFVIDGQQRLSSLAVLFHYFKDALPPGFDFRYRSPVSAENLLRAKEAVHAFAPGFDVSIFSRLRFTVITVTREDLAFTFCDTLNNYLLRHGGAQAHLYLQYLDNHLLCDIDAILSGSDGTSFSHYWFYKLEYILWEKYRDQKDEAWRAFRITAKNSVEHVSSQTPDEYDSNRVDQALHSFGNLGLVSRSINSEYGNKPYLEKQARFRLRNAHRVDSLKLALIYKNEHWCDETAHQHRDDMIGEYKSYFEAVSRAAAQRLQPVSTP